MAVYGEEKFSQLYGNLVLIELDRMIQANYNCVLNFGGRELRFINTPGHARHHFCIWDKLSGCRFTGDTYGVSYRKFDIKDKVFIFPTTTLTQFEPEELIKSITKFMEYSPKYVCLTHFGEIKPTKTVVAQLIDDINYMSNIAKKYYDQEHSEEKIRLVIMQYLL